MGDSLMDMQATIEALTQAGLNNDGLFTRIGSAFALMDVCEEEIDAAMHTNPKCRRELYGSFMLLCPDNKYNQAMPAEVYRKHCKELLGRVSKWYNDDTHRTTNMSMPKNMAQLPTDAEMIMSMSAISFIAPLKPDWYLLYAHLFMQIMPNKYPLVFGIGDNLVPLPPESSKGAMEMCYSELATKMRNSLPERNPVKPRDVPTHRR